MKGHFITKNSFVAEVTFKDVYINIQSKIKINGLLYDPFTLMQEAGQGCLGAYSLCF